MLVRAPENSTGWREPEEEVLGCACPAILASMQRTGRDGAFWVGALATDAVWGRPGQLVSPTPKSPLLPQPPGLCLPWNQGRFAQRKYVGPWQFPLVSGEINGSPWYWERWSAKSRNQNYTKGKTGRVCEIKNSKESVCI